MNNIHPTAIVSSKAKLGQNLEIGPYSVIYDDVEIDDNCRIGPHVVIYDGARIGKNVKIFQSSSVSNIPQDLKFGGEKSLLVIGNNTIIRESVTLHRGTEATGVTKVGNDCLLMAYSHIAHDCVVGNNCILANLVQLGGHAEIGDWVIIGGGTPVHQFSKIGIHAMIAGGFRVVSDVPPFILAAHEPLRYNGLNSIGLRRRGFSNQDIFTIKEAYSILYNPNINYSDAIKILQEKFTNNIHIKNIVDFIQNSNRGIIKG